MIEYSQRFILSKLLLLNLLISACSIVFIAHLPSLSTQAKFQDDRMYISENLLIQNPSWTSVRRFFTEVLEPSTVKGYYQPLTMISLMIDYVLGGRSENPRPFHRTSLLLHTANTGLVIFLLYLLFGQIWIATATGLIFGLHPIVVDSICWVSDRKTVLASFFALWSLVLYVYFTRTGKSKARWGCLAMYVMALLSKPTTTLLPLMMLLMDYWPLRRIKYRTILEKLPLFAIGAVFSVITFISQSHTARVMLPSQYNFLSIPLVLCHNIIFYLCKLIWPANLSAHYEFQGYQMILVSVIGTIIIVCLLAISLRWTRGLLTGWLIFFVAIFPAIGIIRVTNVVAANRYAYLPFVGMLMVLASFLAWFLSNSAGKRANREVVVLLALLIVAGSEVLAMRRYLSHWHDTISLNEHMLTMYPHSAILHNDLAAAFSSQGRTAEAIEHYHQALEIAPSFAKAHYNLAWQLSTTEDKINEAEEHYHKALEFNPYYSKAHINLGRLLQSKGNFKEAIEHFRKSVQKNPEYVKGYYNLGKALIMTDRSAEGINCLRKAVRLGPLDPFILGELAWILATHTDPNMRDDEEALRLAENAVVLTKSRDMKMLDTLAAAYAAKNQFDLAVRIAERAFKLASDAHDEKMADQIRARLELYQQGKPYLEDPTWPEMKSHTNVSQEELKEKDENLKETAL
jgi:tetratricopeptide (TPR) repeat protein